MEWTPQQQSAINEISTFIDSKNPDDKVFILSGYAGTGKTTIIRELIRRFGYTRKMLLMAPTGKAAKVLRERTGFEDACTIHSGIFCKDPVFVHQEEDDVETTEVRLAFPIHETKGKNENWLCIIDEASMISSRKSGNEDLIFGTGVMLDDIMTFVQINSGSKVIFIGDPAQLPPVGDNASNALNPSWFVDKGYKSGYATLSEVVRQGSDSLILRNSLKIRELLKSEERNELRFETEPGEIAEYDIESLIDLFVDDWKNGDTGAVITYSNSSAYSYNLCIRRKLGYGNTLLHTGDNLMIVHNNYYEGEQFFNGDIIEISDLKTDTEKFTINLKKKINGVVISTSVSLEFIDAVIITEDGRMISRKLLTNLLNSNKASLTPDEHRAQYVHLCMRYPSIKDKTEITKILKTDPYFNALRVKYGYAVTCHKAQGSEWKTGYIDYSSRKGFSDDALRWMYTATTRAKKRIYGVGIPDVTPLSILVIDNNIKKLTKTPEGFYPDNIEVPETPFHKPDTKPSLKMKYWLACEALAAKGYSISEIQSTTWRESYIIDGIRYDAIYNGQGVFKRFTPVSGCNQEVLDALNETGKISLQFNYSPESKHLKALYQQISCHCEILDICLTNIVRLNQYCTRYFFITEAFEYAFIDFWCNAQNIFTRAFASSSLGDNDSKLRRLLDFYSSSRELARPSAH